MENVLVDRAPVRLRRPARLLRLTSDERLVALVRGGDEGAFEALYDRHHAAILGFCRHMLGTREEAEDAVQHTFLAAFRDLAGSDKPIDLRPWLFAIARNRCLSLLRARRAHVAIELAEPSVDGLAATVERREDLRELLADLACLPEDQRAALLLAELGALDHAGIAAVLDCPREKVKALVFQARTSLAASREARATPCADIRVELATASGAALRRGPLRRHLRTCDGCRAFKAEVATQRRLFALALPVVPTMALKAGVLAGGSSGASASGGGGAAAVSAAAGTPASGAFGGMLGTVASMGAGKVAISLAVTGIVAGGAFTARIERQSQAPAAHARSHPGSAHAAAHRGAPAPADGLVPAVQGQRPAPLQRAVAPSSVPSPASAPAGIGGGLGAVQTPAVDPVPAIGGASRGGAATPPARTTPPLQHAPGGPSSTPPGQGRKPPGQERTPPGQSTKPPRQGDTPPGQSRTPPGQSRAPPGQSGSAGGGRSSPDGGPPAGAPAGGQPSQAADGGNGNGNGAPPASAGGASNGQSGAGHGQSGAAHGHAG